jgi:hypothetical protein
MVDRIFKIAVVIAIVVFLILFYAASQTDRYQVITQYEGSIGIFDTRQGVIYMLDIEKDEWTVIKPFAPSGATI